MTRKILHLPGTNCTHYISGHCLLEEWRNPGLHREWQCKMLQAWENEYDKFLTQAENFNLEVRMATIIWEQRLGTMMAGPAPCAAYEPVCQPTKGDDEVEEDIFCRHVWLNICILELPKCSGVCQQYLPKTDSDG